MNFPPGMRTISNFTTVPGTDSVKSWVATGVGGLSAPKRLQTGTRASIGIIIRRLGTLVIPEFMLILRLLENLMLLPKSNFPVALITLTLAVAGGGCTHTTAPTAQPHARAPLERFEYSQVH